MTDMLTQGKACFGNAMLLPGKEEEGTIMIPKGCWEKTPKVPLLTAGMVCGCTTQLLSLGHTGHRGPLQERKVPFSQSVLAMFKLGLPQEEG